MEIRCETADLHRFFMVFHRLSIEIERFGADLQEPLPLGRTDDLLEDSEEILEDLDDAKSRLAALHRAQASLRDQLDGTPSWSEHVGGFWSSKQALDWVDAAKGDVSKVTSLLEQDAEKVMARSDALQRKVTAVVKAQGRKYAGHRVVVSMFVLRASPVFLGEMNGTATALVRCVEREAFDSQLSRYL